MPIMTPELVLTYIDKSGPETVPGKGPCHLWTRGVNGRGYGQFRMAARVYVAHAWLHEREHGTIAPGTVRDHVCHNLDVGCPGGRYCLHRRCMNLDHIEVVTNVENIIRGRVPIQGGARQAAKTHCPQGHPYDAVNTYFGTQKGGGVNRICRACRREQARRRRASGAA